MNQNSHFTFQYPMQIGLGGVLSFLGIGLFFIGASPGVFGIDRSPVIGTVQIAFIVIGLGLFSLGSCLSFFWLWRGYQLSISADFGWRLVATGYVVALWTAMADIWGFGTSEITKTLCFGPWQERGVILGEIMIGIGLILLIPWKKPLLKKGQSENHNTLGSIENQ